MKGWTHLGFRNIFAPSSCVHSSIGKTVPRSSPDAVKENSASWPADRFSDFGRHFSVPGALDQINYFTTVTSVHLQEASMDLHRANQVLGYVSGRPFGHLLFRFT